MKETLKVVHDLQLDDGFLHVWQTEPWQFFNENVYTSHSGYGYKSTTKIDESVT